MAEDKYGFTFDEKHFFVDLVFYNRLLKCFVIIDLKIGELEHADLGQMQMYVNYYDRKVKDKTENLTIVVSILIKLCRIRINIYTNGIIGCILQGPLQAINCLLLSMKECRQNQYCF